MHLAELALFPPERVIWVRAVSGEICPPPVYFEAGGGAWGCLQSHLRIVQDAAMDGLENCLILEDDIIFQPNAKQLIERFLADLPSDWDQIYLGGQHLQPPESIAPDSAVLRGMNVNRTHAFALHNRVYQRFLRHVAHAPDYIRRGSWHLDHQLGSAHQRRQWNTYCPDWWIAGQSADSSNISGRRTFEMWWHPASYATNLPFVFVPADLARSHRDFLLAHLHLGWNLHEGTLTDTGLDKVASGYKGLGEWMEMIAREALDRQLLPGLCHPAISLSSLQEQRDSVIVFDASASISPWAQYTLDTLLQL